MNEKLNSAKTGAPEGNGRWVRDIVFGLACVLVIGIFAWIADPSTTFEPKGSRAEDSYYNLLVQGFRAGQLNLKREAPPELARLADPYNPAMNKAVIGDVYDMSFYRGKIYLYFGITPALVLFWPYVTLTGHYLPDKDAVVIFFAVGFLVAAGIVRAVWRRYFPEVSVWVATVGVLTLGLAIGTQKVLTQWCNVYEAALVCGFAFTMLTLAALWRALHEPKQQVKWLALASLAYGLAIGSRPSLSFGVIILLIPVAHAWRAATESASGRQVGLLLLAAVGPVMLVGLGLMVYNALRFDSPFEFGWHYQLNGDYRPTTAHQLSLHYLWFNFRFYFLEPMRWNGRFPFLQAIPPPPLPSGYDGVGDPYAGILCNYPLSWVALAAPLAWRGRPAGEASALRWFVTAVFLLFIICALTLCLFFAAGSRYELDFLPALVLLTATGILGLERAWAAWPVWRRIARWGWCLLLAYSIVFNLLTCVEARAEANCFVGNSLLNHGRADEAIIQYRKALALWPDSANAHGGLGNAFYQTGRLDDAIVQFEKTLDLKPDFAIVQYNLGYCFLQKGMVNKAITHFQRALEIKPDYADAYNTLGDSLLQSGRVKEAIVQYRKALEINPDFAEAHNNLGYSLCQLGQVNEAIVQLQRALEIKPNSAEAHNNLGYSFLRIGRVDEAIIQFQRAIELQPRFVQACNNLGNAFRRKGMAADAVAAYQKTIALQPQYIPAQINLAWLLATWPEPSVRDGSKAVVLAEEANRLVEGKDPRVLRTLAAAYAETGRFPDAVLTARRALTLALAQSNAGLTNELMLEIGLYQTNVPCRSTDN